MFPPRDHEIDQAIDAYLAADAASRASPLVGPGSRDAAEARKRTELALTAILRGRTDAYERAGFRWQLDTVGELCKVKVEQRFGAAAQKLMYRKFNNRSVK